MKLGNLKWEIEKRHECPFCRELLRQNRELHDRLLAVVKPEALRELTAAEQARVMADVETPWTPVAPEEVTERPGTQVGE